MNELLSKWIDTFSIDTEIAYSGNYCGSQEDPIYYPHGYIHFISSRETIIRIPDKDPIVIEKPSLLFFPRPFSHVLDCANDHGIDMVCARTEFDGGFANPLANLFPNLLIIDLDEFNNIKPILTNFFDEAFSTRDGREQIINYLFRVLVVYMVRYLLQSSKISRKELALPDDGKITASLELIHGSYAEELTLEQIAKVAGMSRAKFAAEFKKILGVTPFDYLTSYRIAQAQKLLRKNISVKAVALDVGYLSVPSFNRKFKEIIGRSPKEWLSGSYLKDDWIRTID